MPTFPLLYGHKTCQEERIDGNSYVSGDLGFIQIKAIPERLLPVSVESEMSSAQNNPYAKVAYFGMKSFDPLQLRRHICKTEH